MTDGKPESTKLLPLAPLPDTDEKLPGSGWFCGKQVFGTDEEEGGEAKWPLLELTSDSKLFAVLTPVDAAGRSETALSTVDGGCEMVSRWAANTAGEFGCGLTGVPSQVLLAEPLQYTAVCAVLHSNQILGIQTDGGAWWWGRCGTGSCNGRHRSLLGTGRHWSLLAWLL